MKTESPGTMKYILQVYTCKYSMTRFDQVVSIIEFKTKDSEFNPVVGMDNIFQPNKITRLAFESVDLTLLKLTTWA